MKQILQRLYADRWFLRVYEWARLFTITGLSQALVQGIGFVCGIVVIRLLPPAEYGLYVLANTMVGVMTVLADGGISTGVASEGGQVWKDRQQLGRVLATGMSLRKKFGIASLVVSVPVMTFLLARHDAGILTIVLIALAIIPAFFSLLSGSLLQIAPKLHQDIVPLQKIQVTFNLFRLMLSTLALTLFPFAFVAILAYSLPQVWSNLRLRAQSKRYADWTQNPEPEIQKRILRFVKRLFPGSVYYCISGQISIWLISIFGTTATIAQVGALTRVAMVLTLLSTLINTLIVPRFARLAGSKSLLLGHYLRIQVFLLGVSAVFIFCSWIFADPVLWLLGENYTTLKTELVLATIGGCLNLAVGINYILNSSRGWLLHPVIGIAVGIAGIISGVMLVDVSTVRGVLYFNIFTGIVGLFVHPLFGLLKISLLKK